MEGWANSMLGEASSPKVSMLWSLGMRNLEQGSKTIFQVSMHAVSAFFVLAVMGTRSLGKPSSSLLIFLATVVSLQSQHGTSRRWMISVRLWTPWRGTVRTESTDRAFSLIPRTRGFSRGCDATLPGCSVLRWCRSSSINSMSTRWHTCIYV